MPDLILYDGPESWEENKEEVGRILNETGLEDGDGYFEITQQFPPVVVVPGGIDESSEARFKLDQLERVTVQHEDD